MTTHINCRRCNREIRKEPYLSLGVCSLCSPDRSPKPQKKPRSVATPEPVEPAPVRQEPEQPQGRRFLRIRQVCEKVGLSASQIRRLTDSGDFPQRIHLTERTFAWLESEVEDWQEQRLSRRSVKPA